MLYRRFSSVYKTMLLYYCLKFRKNTESKNPKFVKTKKRKNNAFMKMCNAIVKNQNSLKNRKLVDH